MAALAANAFVDVNAVVEINKIGQIVHSHPTQRLATSVALTHRLKHGRARPYLGVAVHAGLGGRNAGKAGLLDRGVAVTAVNAQTTDVMLVAERRSLHSRLILAGDVGGALQLCQ